MKLDIEGVMINVNANEPQVEHEMEEKDKLWSELA